jgi:hypothetical protein
LRNITRDNDEVDETENPFIALIDKEMENLNNFMDQFESV